jgi:CBS domain-containing protein
MQSEKCCSLLVVSNEGKLSGILTVRDFLAKVLRKEISLKKTTVGEVMTRSPETLRPEHKLAYAVQCMLVGDYRHVPLTDEKGEPVGLISTRQLIQHLTDISGVCT